MSSTESNAIKVFSSLALVLTSACTSIGEVSEDQRDLANSFDGSWIAQHKTTANHQVYRSWEFKCDQFDIPVELRIEDSGIMVLVNHVYVASLNKAYISAKGNFKTSLPTGIKGNTTQSSDVIHSDIEIRLIVEGKLMPEGQGTGSVTIGWETSGYQGCETGLAFTRE